MTKRILVISAKLDVVRRLRDTLEPQGYHVAHALLKVDIAAIVSQQNPELAILAPGLVYDELRSYESQIMKSLRGTSSTARPRVLIASSGHFLDVPCNDDTADMFISEKFVPAELLAYVRRLIGRAE